MCMGQGTETVTERFCNSPHSYKTWSGEIHMKETREQEAVECPGEACLIGFPDMKVAVLMRLSGLCCH